MVLGLYVSIFNDFGARDLLLIILDFEIKLHEILYILINLIKPYLVCKINKFYIEIQNYLNIIKRGYAIEHQ